MLEELANRNKGITFDQWVSTKHDKICPYIREVMNLYNEHLNCLTSYTKLKSNNHAYACWKMRKTCEALRRESLLQMKEIIDKSMEKELKNLKSKCSHISFNAWYKNNVTNKKREKSKKEFEEYNKKEALEETERLRVLTNNVAFKCWLHNKKLHQKG